MANTRKPEDMQKTALEIIARDLPEISESQHRLLSVIMVHFAQDEIWRAFQASNVVQARHEAPKSPDYTIDFAPLPGVSVQKTCMHMADLASVTGQEVKTDFNGTELSVAPGATFEDIEDIVEDFRARRDQAPSPR